MKRRRASAACVEHGVELGAATRADAAAGLELGSRMASRFEGPAERLLVSGGEQWVGADLVEIATEQLTTCCSTPAHRQHGSQRISTRRGSSAPCRDQPAKGT